MGEPSARDRLASIEADLRSVAGLQDPLVRRILTGVLRRQADDCRHLVDAAAKPGAEEADRLISRPDAVSHSEAGTLPADREGEREPERSRP